MSDWAVLRAPPPTSLGQKESGWSIELDRAVEQHREGLPQDGDRGQVFPAATLQALGRGEPSGKQGLYWPRLTSFE